MPKATETANASVAAIPSKPRPKIIAPSRTPHPANEIGAIDTSMTGGSSYEVQAAHAMRDIAAGKCKVALLTYGSTSHSDARAIGTEGLTGQDRLSFDIFTLNRESALEQLDTSGRSPDRRPPGPDHEQHAVGVAGQIGSVARGEQGLPSTSFLYRNLGPKFTIGARATRGARARALILRSRRCGWTPAVAARGEEPRWFTSIPPAGRRRGERA